MKYKQTVTALVLLAILLAIAATMTGIFSNDGPGLYQYTSIGAKQ